MAKWIEVTDSPFGGWHCSKCGYFDWPGKRTSFCPYCGAKMENPYNSLLESVNLYRDIQKIKNKRTDANRTSP